MVTLFGISNCDTVKKARKYLDNEGIAYQFHDFRKDGLSVQQVKDWLAVIGTDTLVNKRSRTWKELSAKQQSTIDGRDAAKTLTENPTLIKRPVLEIKKGKANAKHLVGFDQQAYLALFS